MKSVPYFSSGENEPKTYRGASYHKIELPKELISMLSSFGQKIIPAWSCQYEDYLILSETESGLKNLLSNYLDQNTLVENPNFKALQDRLANRKFLHLGWSIKEPNKLLEKNGKYSKSPSIIPVSEYPLLVFQGVAEEGFVSPSL